jgi:hypothetical protein
MTYQFTPEVNEALERYAKRFRHPCKVFRNRKWWKDIPVIHEPAHSALSKYHGGKAYNLLARFGLCLFIQSEDYFWI